MNTIHFGGKKVNVDPDDSAFLMFHTSKRKFKKKQNQFSNAVWLLPVGLQNINQCHMSCSNITLKIAIGL